MTDVTVRVPGRVNLIGEHLDYNGGHVLPAALSIGIDVTLTPHSDDRVTITSGAFAERANRRLADSATGDWSDAALGAVRQAVALGLLSGGADIAIASTIPPGAGLSSSAALIVAVLKAAKTCAGADLSDIAIARAARGVENEFLSVPCGIMDQMAVAIAEPNEALLLNTATLDYRTVQLVPDHDIVVLHSGVSRRLSDGRYAKRRTECVAAQNALGSTDLCHADLAVIERLADPAQRRRARHCAAEQVRVLSAVAAIEAGDAHELGALMVQSHASMRDLFDISLPAIDALVADACSLGAAGARLTGGGFGGCIVALVERRRREDWLRALMARHPDAQFVAAIAP
ncbi:MAG: galactokinase [Parerythrobacter sp.]